MCPYQRLDDLQYITMALCVEINKVVHLEVICIYRVTEAENLGWLFVVAPQRIYPYIVHDRAV